MINFTAQPEAVALFGVNPQWIEITTDGTDPELVCELIIYVYNGTTFEEITRLRSPYSSQKATFNISQLIPLGYDLPDPASLTGYTVTEAEELIKRYKIEAEEYLGAVQQGSTISLEARAINGRYETLEAMDATFFSTGGPQILSTKPLTRNTTRTAPEWAYLLTQDNTILSCTLVIRITLSDGSIVNDSQTVTPFAQYDVTMIPLGFEALGIAAAESGNLFVTSYKVTISQFHGAGDYDIPIVFNLDYLETDWENPTLIFQNSRGGMDSFTFLGKTERKLERIYSQGRRVITASSTSSEHLTTTDTTSAGSSWILRSGWVEAEILTWAQEFLWARRAWIIENGTFVPVNITEVNIPDQDDQELLGFEVTIKREKG